MSTINPLEPRICAYCGGRFFPNNSLQKYCDKKCGRRAENERQRKKTAIVTCLRCGKTFEAGYRSSRHHCDECKKALEKEKRLEKKLMRPMKAIGKNMGHYVPAEKHVEEGHEPAKSEGKAILVHPVEKKKVYARLKVDPSTLIPPYPLKRAYGNLQERKPDTPYEDAMIEFRTDGEIVNSGEEFTEEEDRFIEDLVDSGETFSHVAVATGRTPFSIKKRYEKLESERNKTG